MSRSMVILSIVYASVFLSCMTVPMGTVGYMEGGYREPAAATTYMDCDMTPTTTFDSVLTKSLDSQKIKYWQNAVVGFDFRKMNEGESRFPCIAIQGEPVK